MQGQGTQHEEEPEGYLRPGHEPEIPNAWYSNIKGFPLGMGFVNLIPRWRGYALSCKVAGSKECNTKQVENEVNPSIPVFDNIAVSFIQCPNTLILSGGFHRDDKEGEIEEEDDASGTCRDYRSHAPTNNMLVVFLQVKRLQLLIV